ncbi:ABC transporter ATP-binding protein [Actinoplanes friuliensis]|uniref:ABC transporter n=1 Tax=Actinoplanes friuliensis DSM 7358 TaxID=1246995 RepID=U5VYI6_9ACTN|nr:ABC transporter ATP-binding protein [Actinoplanes friuliensis]AGZ41954.1 ABC transporter [Actinoplanes friuliensis DSM 7358]
MSALPVADRRTVAREIRALQRRHRGRLAGIVALQVVTVAVGLLPPILLGRLVDGITGGFDTHDADLTAVLIAACLLAHGVLAFVATRAAFTLGELVFAELREDFTDRILALPLGTVEETDSGEILSRTTTDMEAIREIVRTGVPETLIGVLTTVLTVVAAFLIDPLIAGGVLIGLPIIALATRWYTRRAPAAFAARFATRARLTSAVTETARGADTVEAFDLAGDRRDLVRERIGTARDAALVPIGLHVRWFPAVQIGYHLPLLVVLAWGAVLVQQGRAEIGAVAAITLLVRALITPLDDLAYWFGELQSATAAFARIFGVPRAPASPAFTPVPSLDARVEVAGVTFGYAPDRPVLHDVTLVVEPGERVVIVGASGAGKSTLALLIAGVHTAATGRVAIGGTPVAHLPDGLLRDRVALVTQEDHVFTGTVADNLLLARPEASPEELVRALEAAGATWVTDLGAELGADAYLPTPAETQQLAAARLILRAPQVLVLDEATSALSRAQAARLETSLAETAGRRTIIEVAHRLDTATRADRVVMLVDGRIAESGAHQDLLTADGPYARLWQAWLGGQARTVPS